MLALVEHAITAGLKGTGGGTTVTIDVVAIIAGLGVVTDVAHHTVTAGGTAAAIGAGIGVGAVAVIALLTLIDLPITAALEIAGWRTTIARIGIAIITFFKARFVRR